MIATDTFCKCSADEVASIFDISRFKLNLEEEINDAALRWLQYDENGRRHHASRFLPNSIPTIFFFLTKKLQKFVKYFTFAGLFLNFLRYIRMVTSNSGILLVSILFVLFFLK